MNTVTTRDAEIITTEKTLYVSLELGEKRWGVGSTTGLGQAPRRAWIPSRCEAALREEIAKAKRRFGLAPTSAVVSCYEAGREGFSVHRMLERLGVKSHVFDSSSIEVNRRRRRAKSDQLDLGGLLRLLVRYELGEKDACKVVRVPTVEEEDLRQVHRELTSLKKDRTRQINRIKGLLASMGLTLTVGLKHVSKWLEGTTLPPRLRQRLAREHERLTMIERQIRDVQSERHQAIAVTADRLDTQATTPTAITADKARRLARLRSIGEAGAWVLASEVFGWREIRNRRQIGALAGLVPTPYQSGETAREQGISKAGITYVRAIAVELSWQWLRYQPQSALSRWYEERFARGGKRMRKIGIVAMARKLLIALWRYVEQGTLPQGAVLKEQEA